MWSVCQSLVKWDLCFSGSLPASRLTLNRLKVLALLRPPLSFCLVAIYMDFCGPLMFVFTHVFMFAFMYVYVYVSASLPITWDDDDSPACASDVPLWAGVARVPVMFATASAIRCRSSSDNRRPLDAVVAASPRDSAKLLGDYFPMLITVCKRFLSTGNGGLQMAIKSALVCSSTAHASLSPHTMWPALPSICSAPPSLAVNFV